MNINYASGTILSTLDILVYLKFIKKQWYRSTVLQIILMAIIISDCNIFGALTMFQAHFYMLYTTSQHSCEVVLLEFTHLTEEKTEVERCSFAIPKYKNSKLEEGFKLKSSNSSPTFLNFYIICCLWALDPLSIKWGYYLCYKVGFGIQIT